MHILFVADCDRKGGAPHSLFQMVSALGKIDPTMKRSIVIPKNSPLEPYYQKAGCKTYPVNYQSYIQAYPEYTWMFPAKYAVRGVQYLVGEVAGVRSLEKLIDISTVDIIHANSSREDLGAILARKYNKPLVWHIREFGNLDYKIYSYRSDYIKLINESATIIIAVSDAIKTHWINKGIIPGKIIRIYNGINENITPKESYQRAKNGPVRFVMTGAICEAKDQMQLIDAISNLPKDVQQRMTLDIIGEAPGKGQLYLKQIQNIINVKELNQIHLLGYRTDVCSLLSKYDCGIMCSRSEGFGRVTVEYMMSGLPVIASDTGANPEIVQDGITGLLYHKNDTADLARNIERIIADAEMRAKMGFDAAKYARDNYTAQVNAQHIYNVYRALLS